MKPIQRAIRDVAGTAVAVQATKRVAQHYKVLTHGMTASTAVQGYDLHGRWILITGTTDGIGKEAARALFNAGASIVMVSRSDDKLHRVKDEFERQYSGSQPMPELVTIAAELTLTREARRVCEEYLRLDLPLHIFIGNAGILNMHFHHTDEGNEEHLAVHCLANFIMINLLLPQMVKSCHAAPSELASPDAIEGRIVLVSSSEHRNGKLDWNDPNWHHRQPSLTDRIMWRTYADAKLAESLVARDLAFRLSKAHINITSNFVQPGACDTKLHRYDAYSHFRGWLSAYRSPDQGALGPCFIAAREEATGRSGEYWKDDVVAKASRKVTLRDAKRMWQLCEQLTGITWNAGQTVH